MRSLLPERRAAEELAAALEGHARPDVAAKHAGLVATVQLLRDAPEVTPRAEFAADLRARLMVAAEAELPLAAAARPTPLRTATTTRTRRNAGSIAAALVIVGGTTGMAAAASGALPGEPLYPIKLGGEQASQVVRFTDAAKGRAALGHAETRMSEVSSLLRSGQGQDRLVPATLDSFTTAAADGSDRLFAAYERDADPADITAVRTFAAEQMAVVNGLVADLGPDEAGVLLDAADTLAQIDQEALGLCGGCGPDSSVATPAALAQGAGTATFADLLAQPVAQARADAAALRAAQAAQLADLVKRAEDSAATTPRLDLGGATGGAASSGTGPPRVAVVTEAGELLPGTTGRVVDDLVTGVTGTLGGVSAGASGVGKTLGETTTGATDALGRTLGDTTSGLSDGLGGVTGGLGQRD